MEHTISFTIENASKTDIDALAYGIKDEMQKRVDAFNKMNNTKLKITDVYCY